MKLDSLCLQDIETGNLSPKATGVGEFSWARCLREFIFTEDQIILQINHNTILLLAWDWDKTFTAFTACLFNSTETVHWNSVKSISLCVWSVFCAENLLVRICTEEEHTLSCVDYWTDWRWKENCQRETPEIGKIFHAIFHWWILPTKISFLLHFILSFKFGSLLVRFCWKINVKQLIFVQN